MGDPTRTQAFYLVEELARLEVYLPQPRGQQEQQEQEEEGTNEPLSVLGCWRAYVDYV